MRIRLAKTEDGPGPFLAGLIKCDHEMTLPGNMCRTCNERGWRLVPVVVGEITVGQELPEDPPVPAPNPRWPSGSTGSPEPI